MSTELCNLIRQLLEIRKSKRLCTAAAIKQHCWFNGVAW